MKDQIVQMVVAVKKEKRGLRACKKEKNVLPVERARAAAAGPGAGKTFSTG
jgi:hypothetical protein